MFTHRKHEIHDMLSVGSIHAMMGAQSSSAQSVLGAHTTGGACAPLRAWTELTETEAALPSLHWIECTESMS